MRNAVFVALIAACGANASMTLPAVHEVRALDTPGLLDGRFGLGEVSASASKRMQTAYRAQAEAPPLALVPTDGSELALAKLGATLDLDGPLARTELRLTFQNTEARQREGRFSVTLPPGASVARFAMKVGTVWREARVVSRAKGRQVYEQILKQQRDPALLERDQGNAFSARVFPIAPGEKKEIVIAYEHAVAAVQPYVLPLAGLPVVPELTVDVVRAGVHSLQTQSGEKPTDVIVPVSVGSAAIASGDAFVARVELPADGAPASLARAVILVDTSASRSAVMGKQAAALAQLLAAMPADGEVVVAAFDQGVHELYRGSVAGAGIAVGKLLDVGALGASDLGGALTYAANTGMPRLVLVGDGLPTLGERVPAKLAALAHGIGRIDALQVGATIDRDTLGPIIGAGSVPGAILDGRFMSRAVTQLTRAVAPERRIAIAGATTWPASTRGVAPGDPVWVFGRRKEQGTVLRVEIGTQTATLSPVAALDEARVQRAVAGAEVAAITEQLARTTVETQRTQLAARMEKLALAHGLVSMQTSLLVLESDADEQRFLGAPPVETAPDEKSVGGETITINDSAPTIDPTSTSQGITIDREYSRSIPVPGRTFESVLGTSSGCECMMVGSSSVENSYFLDSLDTRRGGFRVSADVMSPLANDLMAQSIRGGASWYWRQESYDDDDEPAAPPPPPPDPWVGYGTPHAGTYLSVRTAITNGQRDAALSTAATAQLANPSDVTALLALGEALEARGAHKLAARAYGSLMDLYPNRAELLRAAGERLDALAVVDPAARGLAIDAYRRALAERPDQAQTHRLLALSLLMSGTHDDEVLALLDAGIAAATDPAVKQVLVEDRAVVVSVLAARQDRAVTERPSLRVVLAWETDANDVDLHVLDKDNSEASYQHKDLASGGGLFADITRGFGPETVTITDPKAFPYRVGVHYYARGPMGVGLGTVQVIRHDGRGHITVDQRPFAIQRDQAFVELPTIPR